MMTTMRHHHDEHHLRRPLGFTIVPPQAARFHYCPPLLLSASSVCFLVLFFFLLLFISYYYYSSAHRSPTKHPPVAHQSSISPDPPPNLPPVFHCARPPHSPTNLPLEPAAVVTARSACYICCNVVSLLFVHPLDSQRFFLKLAGNLGRPCKDFVPPDPAQVAGNPSAAEYVTPSFF